MRHRQKRHQLNRSTSWRKSTLRSMARAVIIHQSIKTTAVKAKAVQPEVDQLITLAKKNDLDARRRAYRVLGDHALVKHLFTDIGPLFAKRHGGYTRIISLANRRGDNARVVILELTEIKKKEISRPPKKKVSAKPDTVEAPEEKAQEEKKKDTSVAVKEKPPMTKKPGKKFLGNLRSIFKKERDSL